MFGPPRALVQSERLVHDNDGYPGVGVFPGFHRSGLLPAQEQGDGYCSGWKRPNRSRPRFGGDYVDGFLTPESVSYHSGHGWLMRERKNVVRVGADEFAAALVGKVEKIELPKPGQWIRQGQKVLAFFRDGEKTEMVSPTEGEVLEINSEVLNNPALLRTGPLRESLAFDGTCSGRREHHAQSGTQRAGSGMDAGSRGTAVFAAAGAGGRGGGGRRTPGGRPAGGPAGCQLEARNR